MDFKISYFIQWRPLVQCCMSYGTTLYATLMKSHKRRLFIRETLV